MLYLGGDRLGAVRELDALVGDLHVGERQPSDDGEGYFVLQYGDSAPWVLVAVRPGGLLEMWSGTEWVAASYLAMYFDGRKSGARQVEADEVAAMKATIGRPGSAHVALAQAEGGARRAVPTPADDATADATARTEVPEVEFRSDHDGWSWLLARKASQCPENWVVTVVDRTGRRTSGAGEAGRSGLFPTFMYPDREEVPRMWSVGDSACHVEVVDSVTGGSTKCVPPLRPCPHTD